MRAVQAHAHSLRADARAPELRAGIRQSGQGGRSDRERRRGHDRARWQDRTPHRPLSDRRRWREQHGAPLARHCIRGLHLAGPAAGGVDAVRFLQGHPRPVVGELCGRSGALVFPAANSGPVAGDVPGQRGGQRRAGAEPRVCAVTDGGRGAGHHELRDLPHHALQGASAGGRDLQARPCFSGGRRRAYQQSARRHGHERRHPRRGQSRSAAGGSVEGRSDRRRSSTASTSSAA